MKTTVEPPQGTAARRLPQRKTPCLARLTAQRPWQQTLALRLGRWDIGVRANSAHASARVEERLAALRVPELDGRLEPNFSVELAGDDGGPARGLHLLYRDHEIVARRRDPEQLLQDLLRVIDETRASECPDLLALHAAAVQLSDHTVLLVPPHWHRSLLDQQTRLARDGWALLPCRTQLVDVESAELVSRALRADPDVRHQIRLWVWRLPEQELRAVRPAEAVQRGFFAVANRDMLGPRPVLEGLAGLTRAVPSVGIADRDGTALVGVLRSLARTG